MVEHLFEALTLAMGRNFQIALAASFAWGVLSILLSPCHLSSVPLIIGYSFVNRMCGLTLGQASCQVGDITPLAPYERI